MQHASTYFHRQFQLESFKKFLGPQILGQLSTALGPRRRKRLLGLEGFLWLGLCVAMQSQAPSLQQIFDWAGTLNSQALRLPLVSVSAFCQYRSFFPSESADGPVAAPDWPSPSDLAARSAFMA